MHLKMFTYSSVFFRREILGDMTYAREMERVIGERPGTKALYVLITGTVGGIPLGLVGQSGNACLRKKYRSSISRFGKEKTSTGYRVRI